MIKQISEKDNFQIPDEILYDLYSQKIYLTSKEKEVLYFIVHGYSNSEIAEILCISIHTVKKHINNIYSKFGYFEESKAYRRLKLLLNLFIILLRKFYNL